MEDGHIKTVDEVVNYFGVDPERGLTLDQVKRNQEKYGPNGKCLLPFVYQQASIYDFHHQISSFYTFYNSTFIVS